MNWREMYSRLGVTYYHGPKWPFKFAKMQAVGFYDPRTETVWLGDCSDASPAITLQDLALHELGHWTKTFFKRNLPYAAEEVFASHFAARMCELTGTGDASRHRMDASIFNCSDRKAIVKMARCVGEVVWLDLTETLRT